MYKDISNSLIKVENALCCANVLSFTLSVVVFLINCGLATFLNNGLLFVY